MAVDTAIIGQKIRELRQKSGRRQSDLARSLHISPTYLNLLEKGRRSWALPLLLRALEALGADPDQFMSSISASSPDTILAHLLTDPLARSLDLDEGDLVRLSAAPKASATIAALFHLYKNARAELDLATDKLAIGRNLSAAGYAPADEVTDFLEAHRNYFPELEEHAIKLRRDARLPRRFVSDQLAEFMRKELGLGVEIAAPAGPSSVVRTFDRETRQLRLSAALSESALKFQLGHMVGLIFLETGDLWTRLLGSVSPRHPETPRLIKIHLANYFAGAFLLPYGDFFEEVQRTRYDVQAIAASFEASYEAVAHRMCNLGDARRRGVPLHFLRVDVAGNISKRYSASGLRFPRGHGSCPKWAVHNAFLTPSVVARQFSMMPDGERYFCFAKVASEPARGSLARGTTYSIGLGCAADDAHHFVYADDLPADDPARTAIPTGISCTFCERTDCNQRAAPSLKFAFAIDEYTKKDNFFSPLTTADGDVAKSLGHGHESDGAPGPRRR